MAKKLMRILGGYITHLSLCPAGANNIQTVYKSKEGIEREITLAVVSKEMNEQGEILSAVYIPEMADKQNDIASADVIKKLAYSFSQSGEGIDVIHNEKILPKSAVYIAETFIIQSADPRFANTTTYDGKPLDATGGWGVVLKVEDEEIRKLYRSGEWKGISMGGIVYKQSEPNGQLANKNQPLINGGDSEMTAEELKALGATMLEANKALATSIVEGVTAALKPEQKKASEPTPEEKIKSAKQEAFMKAYPAPQLPVNATDEQFAHMEKCIRVHELAKSVDACDVRSVFEFQKIAKAIMDGKADVNTLSFASPSADPWGFHMLKSNQSVNAGGSHETVAGPNIISMTAKSDDQLTDLEVKKMLEGIPGYGKVVKPDQAKTA